MFLVQEGGLPDSDQRMLGPFPVIPSQRGMMVQSVLRPIDVVVLLRITGARQPVEPALVEL